MSTALSTSDDRKASKLKTLHLANCSLTNDIIKTIANQLPACLPHLQDLSLSGNTEMTADSLQAITQLVSQSEGKFCCLLIRETQAKL